MSLCIVLISLCEGGIGYRIRMGKNKGGAKGKAGAEDSAGWVVGLFASSGAGCWVMEGL